MAHANGQLFSSFTAALEYSQNGVVTLQRDYMLTEQITISTQGLTLDLGGHTLEVGDIEDQSEGANPVSSLLRVEASGVKICNGRILISSGSWQGICVQSQASKVDLLLEDVDVTYRGGGYALMVLGGSVMLIDSSVGSTGSGIHLANKTASASMLRSQVVGVQCGISLWDGRLLLEDSNVQGRHAYGLFVKSGWVDVSFSTVSSFESQALATRAVSNDDYAAVVRVRNGSQIESEATNAMLLQGGAITVLGSMLRSMKDSAVQMGVAVPGFDVPADVLASTRLSLLDKSTVSAWRGDGVRRGAGTLTVHESCAILVSGEAIAEEGLPNTLSASTREAESVGGELADGAEPFADNGVPQDEPAESSTTAEATESAAPGEPGEPGESGEPAESGEPVESGSSAGYLGAHFAPAAYDSLVPDDSADSEPDLDGSDDPYDQDADAEAFDEDEPYDSEDLDPEAESAADVDAFVDDPYDSYDSEGAEDEAEAFDEDEPYDDYDPEADPDAFVGDEPYEPLDEDAYPEDFVEDEPYDDYAPDDPDADQYDPDAAEDEPYEFDEDFGEFGEEDEFAGEEDVLSETPISRIRIDGVHTRLDHRKPVEFSAHLTTRGGGTDQVEILFEQWSDGSDVITSDSTRAPLPDSTYHYILALRASDGYVFPNYFDIVYKGSSVGHSVMISLDRKIAMVSWGLSVTVPRNRNLRSPLNIVRPKKDDKKEDEPKAEEQRLPGESE